MKQATAALVIVGALAFSVASAGAEDGRAMGNNVEDGRAENTGKNVDVRTDKDVRADNTGKNVRDRSDSALTSGDQSNNSRDVEITSAVRMAVVDDPNLSVTAQNVKIITVGGVVTLRGPVKTSAERENVGAKAQKVAGVTKVDNQLEIASE